MRHLLPNPTLLPPSSPTAIRKSCMLLKTNDSKSRQPSYRYFPCYKRPPCTEARLKEIIKKSVVVPTITGTRPTTATPPPILDNESYPGTPSSTHPHILWLGEAHAKRLNCPHSSPRVTHDFLLAQGDHDQPASFHQPRFTLWLDICFLPN